MACNETLNAFARPPNAGSKTRDQAENGPRSSFLRRVLGDPSIAAEGALPGALSGILAGTVGTIVAGVFSEMYFGEIVASTFLGLATGLARRLNPDFRFKPGFLVLFGGALVGCAVTAIIIRFQWIPLGAALGAAGFFLWVFVCSRVEPGLNPPKPLSQEDDHLLNGSGKTKRRRSVHTAWESPEGDL
jgi:hypothetical protein